MEFKIISKFNPGDKVYLWNSSRGAMEMGTVKEGKLWNGKVSYTVETTLSPGWSEIKDCIEDEVFKTKEECAKYYEIPVPTGEIRGEVDIQDNSSDIEFLLACKRTLEHFNISQGLCPRCKKYILFDGYICPGCGYDKNLK